ncbi:nucleotide sugar dehydrogenase [Candidatus Pelagibacter sp. Uisw_094]|uniref:nucleotide sugar dehydrogenase n=1 Tax=Candidatus Pelagibacter sp. Uisw_094 TaxID=3230980 RepID=UPI0039E900FF|tara:strand:+ start:573 stop:1763 length:1191 start_codon:yes stop_codon:yes gene_type:complete
MKKITIIGATGHIGLPLSILFANKGFKVIGYDINSDNVKKANKGIMLFKEDNGLAEFKKARKKNNLYFIDKPSDEMKNGDFLITVGTPVDEFMNPDLNQLKKCINSILPYLNSKSLIILRSTVFPGTSEWLKSYLLKKKIKAEVAFCLERVVQGKTFEEIKNLPQIVAATSQNAKKKAANIFKHISKKIIFSDLKEAEFSKLFSNAFRYIQFAISNEFFMIANSAGLNFEKIRKITTDGYPRAGGMPSAGFAAGPCLFKDTMQLMASNQNNFNLGINSMLVNEGLVLYLIKKLSTDYNLSEKNVGILGMAFKSECDDIRSSLSYKLKNNLNRLCKNVFCSDPYVTEDKSLYDLNYTIKNSDIIIIGAPHKIYKKLNFKNKKVIDIWGMTNIENSKI